MEENAEPGLHRENLWVTNSPASGFGAALCFAIFAVRHINLNYIGVDILPIAMFFLMSVTVASIVGYCMRRKSLTISLVMGVVSGMLGGLLSETHFLGLVPLPINPAGPQEIIVPARHPKEAKKPVGRESLEPISKLRRSARSFRTPCASGIPHTLRYNRSPAAPTRRFHPSGISVWARGTLAPPAIHFLLTTNALSPFQIS